VLVAGSGESVLPLELASLGYDVVALDLRDYPLAHPRLTSVKEDIRRTELPRDTFDTVVAVSTLEHIGLGFYGDPVDPDGDRNAAAEIGRVLKPGGRFLLTVPFGRAATAPGHRVYDAGRLRALGAGFEVEELVCCVREGPTCWRPAGVEEAERVDSSSAVRGVALLSLRKPDRAF
jgi:SAM-dependent methyltransferase